MLWPGVCPSVRLSVCQKLVLYWNSCIHHRANKYGISGTLLQFIPNYPTVTPLVLWLQLASFMEKVNCYDHLTWAGDRWSISAPITFCIHSRIVGMTHPLILYLGIHTKTLYISKHSHPVTCSNSYEQVSAVTDKSTRRTAHGKHAANKGGCSVWLTCNRSFKLSWQCLRQSTVSSYSELFVESHQF